MVYVKRALRLFLFGVGLLAILFVTSAIFAPKNNTRELGMEEASANGILGEKENSIDVLVLGDSESYSSISPMEIWKETGYTVYVCGTKGQHLGYSATLLERAFERQSPKVVILETNAIYRNVSWGALMYEKVSNYFSIFRYHDRWKSLKWEDFSGRSHSTWTDDFKGYCFDAKAEPGVKKDYMKYTDEASPISETNKQYVRQIRDFCRSEGAEFILLSTPSTKNWNYKRHNGIQALADSLGCAYLDLNLMEDQVGIDWSADTRDQGDHLNYFGAVKVTRFLAGYLSELAVLEDHRNDPDYASWNEALERYETSVMPNLLKEDKGRAAP